MEKELVRSPAQRRTVRRGGVRIGVAPEIDLVVGRAAVLVRLAMSPYVGAVASSINSKGPTDIERRLCATNQ